MDEPSGSGVDARFLGARNTYAASTLDVADVDPDPVVEMGRWIAAAEAAGVVEPTAMGLSTVRSDGSVSSRTVLLRAVGAFGLEFFTNTTGAKAQDLATNRNVALLFSWPDLQRQVRIEGTAEPLPGHRSDEYFADRPRGSQIGAWASPQSQVLVDRAALEARVAEIEERFAEAAVIPRPPHWGGYGVTPMLLEFWQGRPSRLHDRIRYRRAVPGDDPTSSTTGWIIERLAP